MTQRSPIAHIFIAVAVAALMLLACSNEQPKQTIKMDDQFPQLTLSDLSGKNLALSSIASGKLTAVLLWREGCTFCEREMPLMQPLYTKYSGKGFALVAVHLGGNAGPSAAMASRHSLTFPMLVDNTETLKQTYGIRYVPMVFLIDSRGRVVEKILGGVGAADLERIIKGHLK